MSEKKWPLDFDALQGQVALRSHESYGTVCADWTLGDWGNALAGETGEACNKIKKRRRGEPVPKEEIGKELADVVIYAAAIADLVNLDLGECVRAKFNERSEEIGSTRRL